MSEWASVLAVFWILWALDGARLGPRRSFTVVGGPDPIASWWGRLRGVRVYFSRLSLPGISTDSWRVTVADVPVALSPVGLCNRPAGTAGRPADVPAKVRAWRWEDIRQAGVADGWVFVNDERFCPDTGHLSAAEILRLARLVPGERDARIRAQLSRWFRPGQLRRRVRVLVGRTRWAVGLNTVTVAGMAALTIYLLGDVASRIPAAWSERLASALPALLLALLATHVAAVVMAWRSVRHLRAVRPEKRGANLFSALLLPPQALRLRALLGEGYFPAQHPLGVVAALSGPKSRSTWGFNVLADLRWPIDDGDDVALARDVTAWYRTELGACAEKVLEESGVGCRELLAPPVPHSPESCRYCPRCGDQFVAGREVCPQGVALKPLPRTKM